MTDNLVRPDDETRPHIQRAAVRLIALDDKPAIALVSTSGTCATLALDAIRALPEVADIEAADTEVGAYMAETTVMHDQAVGLFNHTIFLKDGANPATVMEMFRSVVQGALNAKSAPCEVTTE